MAIDLAADLSAVFFSDFVNQAIINGQSVSGYLDVNAHQFLDLNVTQSLFTAPAAAIPAMQSQQALTIDGVNYRYVAPRRNGDMLGLIVEKV
jgi:hypothetical protein